ncbi:MAG: hypothetical protein KU38_08285 [Sulfurovum sp. FS08-3]|nr:MAG: hypothetical protein KU38_08285 [Sulfurovum sp. FS08-3]
MILYIHGFGSSGVGSKALKFKEHYAHGTFIAPSLSYVPLLAIDTLKQFIEYALAKGEKVHLIGSSLGGYMAIFLATHYNLKAVLINPSIKPTLTLQKARGLNYYDLSSFEWNTQHLKMLENFNVTHPNPDNYLLLLQKGDETLDYREALHFFEHQGINPNRIILEEGGNHSFENIESKFEIMDAFFDT